MLACFDNLFLMIKKYSDKFFLFSVVEREESVDVDDMDRGEGGQWADEGVEENDL